MKEIKIELTIYEALELRFEIMQIIGEIDKPLEFQFPRLNEIHSQLEHDYKMFLSGQENMNKKNALRQIVDMIKEQSKNVNIKVPQHHVPGTDFNFSVASAAFSQVLTDLIKKLEYEIDHGKEL